jgi:hypothetical protein
MGDLMSGIAKSIDANINDIIYHANSIVTEDIHKLNKEFYEGYQWIACLDSVTCLACAELDNRIFDRLPGMEGEGSEPPAEPPLHNHCRCFIVPVLEGMKDDPSQTQINYKDWFNRQNEKTKLDILGPSRYKEYLSGREVTSFAKDGRIMTLKEMGVDRITRRKLFDDIYEKEYKDYEVPEKYDRNGINGLYNDKMTAAELLEVFKSRYGYFRLDLNEMPKEQLQLLLREYDLLLQKYPVGSRLTGIEIDTAMSAIGAYNKNNRVIYLQRAFLNENVKDYIKELYKTGYLSSNKENHIYIHEFAHALDYVVNKNGKTGRQLLLAEVKKQGHDWQDIADKISKYATKISGLVPSSRLGGEFFAEAFTAWNNKAIDKNDTELKWIIDFFNNLFL